MKRMRGISSDKEKLSLIIQKLAKKSTSLSVLKEKLIKNNIQPYLRNHKLTGVYIGKRKLRLTTLGIDKTKLKEMTKEEERIAELKKTKYTKDIEIKK